MEKCNKSRRRTKEKGLECICTLYDPDDKPIKHCYEYYGKIIELDVPDDSQEERHEDEH